MVAVPEVFYRRTKMLSIQYQLTLPMKALTQDPNRLWASFVTSQLAVDVAVSTNPRAQVGDPDTCVFLAAQGAVFFETYGQNELYIIGLPVGTSVAITTCCKNPRASYPTGRSYRNAMRTETICGGGPITFSGGFAPLLPADSARRRAHVKIDSAFGALSDGVDGANFMSIVPNFPGYAVVEGTEALHFTNFGTGPANAWWIVDREVSAT